ncbi:MAG: hypothetical protein WAV95_16165 [Azonexus sp.]
MALRKRFGLLSLLVGVFALPVAMIASYLQSLLGSGSGAVLQWLDRMGVVSQSDMPAPLVQVLSLFPDLEKLGLVKPVVFVSGVPEMTEISVFSLNDGRAMSLLLVLSVLLSLVAIGAALWAEYRRESTAFASAGYICGVLALALVWPLAGLVSAIAGIAAVLVLRYQRERQGGDPISARDGL